MASPADSCAPRKAAGGIGQGWARVVRFNAVRRGECDCSASTSQGIRAPTRPTPTNGLRWRDGACRQWSPSSALHLFIQVPVPQVVYCAAGAAQQHRSRPKQRQQAQVWRRARWRRQRDGQKQGQASSHVPIGFSSRISCAYGSQERGSRSSQVPVAGCWGCWGAAGPLLLVPPPPPLLLAAAWLLGGCSSFLPAPPSGCTEQSRTLAADVKVWLHCQWAPHAALAVGTAAVAAAGAE
jgi:hypothetical protein